MRELPVDSIIEAIDAKIEALKQRRRELALQDAEAKTKIAELEDAKLMLRDRGETGVKKAKTRGGKGGKRRAAEAPADAPMPDGPSMASIIKETVLAQPGEFTSVTIRELLKKNHPQIAARLPESYITSQIWKLSNKGAIRVVRPGGRGNPTIYVVINPTTK